MTYQEALKLVLHGEYADADEMIIEALQKQIPKKPEAYYDGFYGVYPVWEYQCPCCGRDVDDTEHHCECGQAIDWDWGEEE